MELLQKNFNMAITTWKTISTEIGKVLVGQNMLIDRLIMAIALNAHVLVEGLPGLAKTLSIKLLAETTGAGFSRIQFTPDLLPADITGTMIYSQQAGYLKPHKGPIFSNVVLADEINRAPAKVHAALLQAMEERSVTLGKEVHTLPSPFVVMATQNPIEQEGTYELPEAQLDRFLFKLIVDYPSLDEEHTILSRADDIEDFHVSKVSTLASIKEIGAFARHVNVEDSIKKYIVNIVDATRGGEQSGIASSFIRYGASPRASLALFKVARIEALRHSRSYVTPR